MDILLTELREKHWSDVRRIYSEGIETGNATFETTVPSWVVWNRNHRQECRIVAVVSGQVMGWAAVSNVSSREAYAGVAEVSVYVAERSRGYGIGTALLGALVDQSERAGIWTLQAGIFPENKASVALHARCGFRVVGTRKRIGRLRNAWRDVLLMERRSESPHLN